MKKLFLLMLLAFGCYKKQMVEQKVVSVEVTKPKVETLHLFNSYVGHLQPFVQVQVQAQVEGTLTGYYFKEGQEVKKGHLIFTIDPRRYEAQLAKAEAALAMSTASLQYAQDVVKRNAHLVQQDYISQLQYDEYLTDVKTYQAAIQENEADIETAKINISYCNIHSPIDAITGKLQLQVGNLIANAENTPLVILNQISPIYVYFSIPQKDLPRIMDLQKTQTLKLKVFLGGDEKNSYEGTLDLIDNQVDDQTGSILLRGVVPNEEKMLWPGEFVDIHLLLEEKKDALLIPTEAISYGQKGKYVYIVKSDDTVETRVIQTAQRFDKLTLVESGITAEEPVVLEGQINLSNGVKVSVKERKGSS